MQFSKKTMGQYLDRDDLNEGYFRWHRGEYTVNDKGIVVPVALKEKEKTAERFEMYAPLEDPNLLFSFARLAARGKPLDKTVLAWVNRHGLLFEEKKTWPEYDNINQRPIKMDSLIWEAKQANSLLNLLADLRSEDRGAFEARLFEVRNQQKEWKSNMDPEAGDGTDDVDDVLLHNSGLESTGQVWKDFLIGFDVMSIFNFALDWRLRAIRLRVQPRFETPFRTASVWYCPNLYSAIYLHLYFLATDQTPLKQCEVPTCRMPFEAKPKHKRFCSDTCRSNARNYR